MVFSSSWLAWSRVALALMLLSAACQGGADVGASSRGAAAGRPGALAGASVVGAAGAAASGGVAGMPGTSTMGSPVGQVGQVGQAGRGGRGGSNVAGIGAPSGTAAAPAAVGGNAAPTAPASNVPAGACQASMDRLRISEIDVGASVVTNEDEVGLKPIVIAPLPTSGARLAFMGSDNLVHVVALGADDQPSGSASTLMGYDFADMLADDTGGVVLLTRVAHGAGDKHCGTLTNLCGSTASLPSQYACFDMYLVRFDGANETWATQLSQSSDMLPPYLNSPTEMQRVVYIWQTYAHHGRLAFDGMNYAAYYGAAISVSQSCVNADSALKTAINIHQGDEMRVIGSDGKLVTGHGSFDWGCSHSGFERVIWDGGAKKFVPVCKTDNNNRIAFAPNIVTILPVDLSYADLGNVVAAQGGGYWLTTSNIRAGQPAMARGLAEVLLVHFTTGMADKTLSLTASAPGNQRAPHLSTYGKTRLLAAWESTSATGDIARTDKNRKFTLQVLDAVSGAVEGPPLDVAFLGNRYQDLVAFPDGSVAFTAPGSGPTKVKILRVLPCGG
jgi:hypothetical protein